MGLFERGAIPEAVTGGVTCERIARRGRGEDAGIRGFILVSREAGTGPDYKYNGVQGDVGG